jgi:hypothetical protein
VTGPQTTPSRQELEHLIDAHGATLGRRDPHRWRLGTKRLLDWLESIDGPTWQDRWDAAGVEAEDSRWTGVLGLNKDYEHYAVTAVFQALLCLRLIRPGYSWLVRQPFSSLAAQMRLSTDRRDFERLFETARATKFLRRTRIFALIDVSAVNRSEADPLSLVQRPARRR